MRRLLAIVLACAALLSPRVARADGGAHDGESARAAALADAVTARAGDTSAIGINPAGIADVDRTTITLLGHAAYFHLNWSRPGEAATTSERGIGGYGVSLIVPLPGPDWLRRVHLGAAVNVPSSGIITVEAPTRDDIPEAPMYGSRLERTAASFALGIALPAGIDIGIGVTVAPTLLAPTAVSYDASRGETVDDGVIVRLDRDVQFGAAMLVGIRYEPVPQFAVGLVYRQGVTLRAAGPVNLRAGSVLANDPLDFTDVFSPDEVALGLAFTPTPELSFSTDATWSNWSGYRTIHDEVPNPRFRDTVSLRGSIEYVVDRWAALRVGYAWEPTPVPPQVAVSSYLDADRHILTGGLGIDLEPLTRAPLHIDLYFRGHILDGIGFTKDRDALGDSRPLVPGQQIDALGFPSVSAGITYFQAGLSMTLALGGHTDPDRVIEDDAEATP
jgi:long-chain fatty acid transport protein